MLSISISTLKWTSELGENLQLTFIFNFISIVNKKSVISLVMMRSHINEISTDSEKRTHEKS